MDSLIVRRSKLFSINKDLLKPAAKKEAIYNALYAAIYLEFIGAAKNPTYRNIPPKEMLEKVNVFAWKWLEDRGLK